LLRPKGPWRFALKAGSFIFIYCCAYKEHGSLSADYLLYLSSHRLRFKVCSLKQFEMTA